MDEQAAKKLAQYLVQAENTAGVTGQRQADDLLSRHFIKLTRSGKPDRGEQEPMRERFLDDIRLAEPNSPKRLVEFDEHPGAWPVGAECWIVRGVVTTKDRNAPERDGRFRNTWILGRDEGGEWRVLALQVTRLQR